MDRTDRLFTVFPLYHVNARYTSILAALMADCDVVMHNRFSASKFWDICRKEKNYLFQLHGITTYDIDEATRADQ